MAIDIHTAGDFKQSVSGWELEISSLHSSSQAPELMAVYENRHNDYIQGITWLILILLALFLNFVVSVPDIFSIENKYDKTDLRVAESYRACNMVDKSIFCYLA